MKRLPIKAAKEVAVKYKQALVVLVTWDSLSALTHVVTYGKSLKACEHAAEAGNFIKKMLGFPVEMCNTVPARLKRKDK